MKVDKIKIYIFEILLVVILLFALFVPNIFTRKILAIVLFLYMLIVCYILKKRRIKSINKKQVTILMVIFSFLYIVIFYLLGLYFGFTKSKVMLSIWSIFNFILPLSIIIFSSEIIRNVFLSQKIYLKTKKNKINLSPVLTYISMVLIDLLIYTGIYNLNSLDNTLTALGFVLFASLSCNLLYNYVSKRYGSKGIIVYRLITTLYVYIIPVNPDIYLFFQSFIRMIYPYIIYLVIEKFFSTNDFAVAYNDRKKEVLGNTVLLVITALFIMLISCQFKYGILVIGSDSMTGTINKGDAIIFEKYDEQLIQEGQIILFDYNGIQTVHRVVDIKSINGKLRFYTKGDANKHKDTGYITEEEIYGLVKLKVKYLGYPTLWVRSLFSEE